MNCHLKYLICKTDLDGNQSFAFEILTLEIRQTVTTNKSITVNTIGAPVNRCKNIFNLIKEKIKV
jgi:hypothetical protein